MDISVSILWITCWLMAQGFPSTTKKLGSAGSFWVFSVICLACFIYVLKVLPETKGKTFEAVERELVD